MEKMKKPQEHICLAASAGGHLNELLAVRQAWEGKSVFFMTTQAVARSSLEKMGRCYVIGESNREQPLKAIPVLCRCIAVVLKERPTTVISTGALHGCLACYIAKVLLRSKVVWLDSITNTDRPSLSGRLTYPIADLFILQQPALLSKYPKAEYLGTVI